MVANLVDLLDLLMVVYLDFLMVATLVENWDIVMADE